ncbi:MAG: arginine--tRNA ligase [Patescibacteria group bacterium]
MEELLKNKIKEALQALGIEDVLPALEFPAELSHGDFSTNVALVAAKNAKLSPKALAERIVDELGTIDGVEKIEVAGPGFINFILPRAYFSNTILGIDEMWGENSVHYGKKIVVEHSSPNLFKPFHIGHVMNNAIGESMVRLMRFSGAEVAAISYPSDVSLGIGKAVWVILNDGGVDKLRSIGGSVETLAYLGDCYVQGTKLYEENAEVAQAMKQITSDLYEKKKGEAYRVYEEAKEINLAYFKTITSRLGSTFDDFIFESEAGIEGTEIVRANTPAVFSESQGAFIYEGEKDNLHTRVFINKEGYPTYEAKDVGLLSLKFKKYNPALSIFVTDHEQEQYFKVVIAAAGKIKSEWKDKTVHVTHGRMTFKGKKMSSRLGGVPIAQTLVDSLFSEVAERAERLDAEKDWSSINAIGVASLKYSILRAGCGKNIDFDPEQSLSFEGDSGPYLQYSYVRAKSVLEKANSQHPTVSSQPEVLSQLERLLPRFPHVVLRAQREFEPHFVTTYLTELASAFNSWYANEKIIGGEHEAYKLALTRAFAQTMKNGLWLLGIAAPEKM